MGIPGSCRELGFLEGLDIIFRRAIWTPLTAFFSLFLHHLLISTIKSYVKL